jgi:hypothetical protein
MRRSADRRSTPEPGRDALIGRRRIRTAIPSIWRGGILFIREETFEGATLTTFDGNDYFIISIKTRCLEIFVHDGDSTYLDLRG